MIIRTLTNKPTDSKEAFYFLLCEVSTTNTGGYKSEDTLSPLMVFSKLFLVQEHLFKENVTILCINANFTRNFALV